MFFLYTIVSSLSINSSKTEMDSLAEFELYEEAMDNDVSFCSNSSLVKKLTSSDQRGHKVGSHDLHG